MKVLITGGATQEPIDQVRVLTNLSTGRTAATIADAFIKDGFDVTYVHGVKAALPMSSCTVTPFTTHACLDETLTQLLSRTPFDAVIHLAAVSDYTLASIHQGDQCWLPNEVGKIKSGENILLNLQPTRKIIHHLKEEAVFKDFLLIGFKLTVTRSEEKRLEAVKKLTKNPAINFVVHNDLHDITSIEEHAFAVYQGERIIHRFLNVHELSLWLVDLVTRHCKE